MSIYRIEASEYRGITTINITIDGEVDFGGSDWAFCAKVINTYGKQGQISYEDFLRIYLWWKAESIELTEAEREIERQLAEAEALWQDVQLMRWHAKQFWAEDEI